ncbi:uncharacterized protein LOC126792503 [Argentina anserina]|uniref:uncharacterized protein LOC126792503 n=1 Tax=Argentina anserina TaxID=57926 RepID=UPI00217624CD|nr:uncharacterized protein LOC126792503 [Potentilla anserina]
MEHSRAEKKPRFLGIFGIIRAAVQIPFINPSFIAFTFITSLPMFCILILPKLSFVPSEIRDAFVQLEQPNSHSNMLMSVPLVNLSALTTFLATVTVIDCASTIYKGGAGRSIGLRDLLGNSIIRKRWHSCIFAYIIMSWFSKLSLDAVLLYGKSGPFSSLRNEWAPPLHFLTLLGISFVRDECSAWWQLALVVSVLEEDKLYFDDLLASSELRKGNRIKGFALMLLYFGWRCLVMELKRWRFTMGVAYDFVDSGLFCLGTIMNWVACTVYYHDCKNRQSWELVAANEE